MKKAIFLTVILSVILSFVSCNRNNWVAKIDDEVITIDDFNKMYYFQTKLILKQSLGLDVGNDEIDKMAFDPSSLPPQLQQVVNKKNFLDQLVAQKVAYNKAMSDDTINKDELKTFLELSKLQVSQYYLLKKVESKISVTEKEVEKFYNENPKQFKGVPIDEKIESQIKQYIRNEKAKLESNTLIMDLMAEVKINKEGFRKYMDEQNKKQAEKKPEADKKPATDKK